MKAIIRAAAVLTLLSPFALAGDKESIAPKTVSQSDYSGQYEALTRDPNAYRRLIWKVRFDIDRLNKEIEEWGTVTVSAPVVMNVQNQYPLQPLTTDFYGQESNFTAGKVSQSTQTSFSDQLSVNAAAALAASSATGQPVPVLGQNLTPPGLPALPTLAFVSTTTSPPATGGSDGASKTPGNSTTPSNQGNSQNSQDGSNTNTTTTTTATVSSGTGSQTSGTGALPVSSVIKVQNVTTTGTGANNNSNNNKTNNNNGNADNSNTSPAPGDTTASGSNTKGGSSTTVAGVGSGGATPPLNSPWNSMMAARRDQLTDLFITTMANPTWDKFTNKDYEIVFAIVQVSCNPGWRTRNNYIADLSANCEYYDTVTHSSMPDSEGVQPIVFSVLPLLDAQSLDLENTDQHLTSLAAQLSASYPTVGLSIAGQDLITFVHQYQKTYSTRTPMTVTNSYSTGRTFGFRFAPSLTAMNDPAYRKSRAANILQATTFPVLVTVVTNRTDMDIGYPGHYNSIVTHISTNWLINDRPPLTVWYRRLYTPLRREGTMLRTSWASDLANIHAELTLADSDRDAQTRVMFDPVYDTLNDLLLGLKAKCVPQDLVFKLNGKPQAPTITDVDAVKPQSARQTTVQIFAHVTGLVPEDVSKVTMDGTDASNWSVGATTSGMILIATFPTSAFSDGNLVVQTNRGTFATHPVKFTPASPAAPTPPPPATPTLIQSQVPPVVTPGVPVQVIVDVTNLSNSTLGPVTLNGNSASARPIINNSAAGSTLIATFPWTAVSGTGGTLLVETNRGTCATAQIQFQPYNDLVCRPSAVPSKGAFSLMIKSVPGVIAFDETVGAPQTVFVGQASTQNVNVVNSNSLIATFAAGSVVDTEKLNNVAVIVRSGSNAYENTINVVQTP